MVACSPAIFATGSSTPNQLRRRAPPDSHAGLTAKTFTLAA
jgi:hypothetical protein